MKPLRLLVMLGAIVVGTAIVACNDDDDKGDPTATTDATQATGDGGAETVTVQVDGDGDGYDAFMIAYFPKTLTLHAGDTVKFKLEDTGEPHTVTTGGPVTDLLDFVLGYCGPEGFEAAKCADDAEIPPDVEAQFDEIFGKLPQLLPDGPGDANQLAANPCFLATGTLPEDEPCPEVDQPAFSGDEAFYNSGWLGPDEDFEVVLADDLAPGDYTFICLLHGPEMTETITVVEDSADSDTADEVDARREQDIAAAQASLDDIAASLKTYAGEDLSGVSIDVQAGDNSEELPYGVAEFGPEEITITPGGSVTWIVNGPHTISFNAPEDAKALRLVAADGTVHLNEEGLGPAQVEVPEPPAEEGAPPEGEGEPPPEEEGPPDVLDGGSWNGEGFLSSGFLDGGAFKLTFAEVGTYEYKCLIHDGMEGTVTVE